MSNNNDKECSMDDKIKLLGWLKEALNLLEKGSEEYQKTLETIRTIANPKTEVSIRFER